MAELTFRLNTDNVAFHPADNGVSEVVRILRDLAQRIKRDGLPGERPVGLRDINGNRVGHVEYLKDVKYP